MASHVGPGSRGRRGWFRRGLLAAAICGLFAGGALTACTCDAGEDASSDDPSAGAVPSAEDLPAACLAFCARANQCATEQGRPLPEGAAPCEAACDVGGLYRRAPPEVWACASRDCGPAFGSCAETGLLRSMRASETPVFPTSCIGLCNRLDWCAERIGRPSPATGDCERACGAGGLLAVLPRETMRCANSPCGAEMGRCLAGAGAPAEDLTRLGVAPPPASPGPAKAP